jgi:cell division protein FtsN
MIRLIGILTGSAIAVAFLIVVLGIPELEAPQTAEKTLTDSVTEIPEETVAEPEPAAEAPAEPAPASEPTPEPVVAAVSEAVPDAQPEPIAPVERQAEPIEHHWYAFWSPFRSKIAADGFVSQLQRTTGLDYRVVKLKPGVYEVAFAYSDDADIQDKLTQISSATGLDLSGG